jgi:hypothetical protein
MTDTARDTTTPTTLPTLPGLPDVLTLSPEQLRMLGQALVWAGTLLQRLADLQGPRP